MNLRKNHAIRYRLIPKKSLCYLNEAGLTYIQAGVLFITQNTCRQG